MAKKKYTKDLLEPIIKESFSWAEAMRKLDIKNSGGMHRLIKSHVVSHGIDFSHFKGRGWSKGLNKTNSEKINNIANLIKKPDEQVFKKGSTYQGSKLKERLIKDHGWKDECSVCGLTDWLGNPITLHLDHIDGDHTNNEFENLRIICPNCHQQTKTWGSTKKKHKKCKCGKEISKKASKCKSCVGTCRNEKIVWPNDEDLLNMVKETNYLQTSKKLGVSDNAIRKRLKRRNLI